MITDIVVMEQKFIRNSCLKGAFSTQSKWSSVQLGNRIHNCSSCLWLISFTSALKTESYPIVRGLWRWRERMNHPWFCSLIRILYSYMEPKFSTLHSFVLITQSLFLKMQTCPWETGSNGFLYVTSYLPLLITWLEKKWQNTDTNCFHFHDDLNSWNSPFFHIAYFFKTKWFWHLVYLQTRCPLGPYFTVAFSISFPNFYIWKHLRTRKSYQLGGPHPLTKFKTIHILNQNISCFELCHFSEQDCIFQPPIKPLNITY